MPDQPAHIDTWRHGVSQDLGEIKANISFLVETRKEDSARLSSLEQRVNRAGGIAAALLAILPFFTDKIKTIFIG